MVPPPNQDRAPHNLEPVPTLLQRTRAELSAEFDFGKPMRVSRAPGRLDVMGGIADYTGSMVCEMPLDRAAAVVTQNRADRELQIFSFNLFDEHLPFTFRISLDALAEATTNQLRAEFTQPGRNFAGYIAGCLHVLHSHGHVNLLDPAMRGINLALHSTVPLGAGVSSSAAIEVASMMAFLPAGRDRSGAIDGLTVARLCQQVENEVVGAPCGIMDQVTSCLGEKGRLLRMICRPHELLPPLDVPRGFRFVGINSNVKHSVGGGMYGRTRCAAFIGHAIILSKMHEMGRLAGKSLVADPMNGYLANLDPDDYKQYFRPALPEYMPGREFVARYGSTIDRATVIEPDFNYHIQHACDHHVLEVRRVRHFAQLIEEAHQLPDGSVEKLRAIDKAGHLMYASHLSYSTDAMLGAPECDLLVDLVRKSETHGLYGAKITGGGSGGTVAVLCREGEKADRALGQIMSQYTRETGHPAQLLDGSSPGAWWTGARVIP